MADIETVSIAIASAGVFLGVIYYIFQLRHQAKTRQTDLVMKLYSEWGGKDFLEAYQKFLFLEFKDYQDFKDKYPLKVFRASEAYVSYNMCCAFFERVGVLLHRGLIDIELVDDLFSGAIKGNWEKVRPIVEGVRKEQNVPQYWEWFEYLYNEMTKREQKLQQQAGLADG